MPLQKSAPRFNPGCRCYAGKRPVDEAFRHFTLVLSQPLGDSGFVWSLQALIGGENRAGVSQKNRLTGAISYTF